MRSGESDDNKIKNFDIYFSPCHKIKTFFCMLKYMVFLMTLTKNQYIYKSFKKQSFHKKSSNITKKYS